MEDELKECHNRSCRRRGVLIARPNSKYCSSCGSKLKGPTWRSQDQPPLLDAAPDINRHHSEYKPQRRTHMPDTTIPTKAPEPFKLHPHIPPMYEFLSKREHTYADWCDLLEKHNIQPFQKFNGGNDAYTIYLNANGVIRSHEELDRLTAPNGNTNLVVMPKSNALAKPNDTFTCEPDPKGCPIVEPINVNVTYIMYRTWIHLAGAFKTEWIAYLKGTYDAATRIWTITDMYFPKQRANGTHCDAEDNQVLPDTIGAIHSHVAMAAFFSTEDEKHFNHPVELVINNEGKMDCSIRTQLECGRYSRVKGKVYLLDIPAFTEAEAALTAQLTEQTPVVVGFAKSTEAHGPARGYASPRSRSRTSHERHSSPNRYSPQQAYLDGYGWVDWSDTE